MSASPKREEGPAAKKDGPHIHQPSYSLRCKSHVIRRGQLATDHRSTQAHSYSSMGIAGVEGEHRPGADKRLYKHGCRGGSDLRVVPQGAMRSSNQVTDVLLEGPSPSRNGWAAGFGLYTVYSGRCHNSETGPPALLPAPAVKAPQRNGIGPGPPALSYWERPEGAHSAEQRGRGSPARRGDEPRPPAGRFFSSAQEMVEGKGLPSLFL